VEQNMPVIEPSPTSRFEVEVIESYDGFSINLIEHHPDGLTSSQFWPFNQEDSVQDLIEVFKELGVETRYIEGW
jgi:hypothetical protein